jgi:hypothetical protein
LIVSNPPHFVDQYAGDICAHDPDWRIHKNFFETVSQHLAEDGVIVLQENNRGSTVATFRPMIEQSGFEIFFTHGDHPSLTKESSFYFIGIGRGRARPAWAREVGRIGRLQKPKNLVAKVGGLRGISTTCLFSEMGWQAASHWRIELALAKESC